jgi:hypothetical protein
LKKIVSRILFVLLLVSVFTGAFNVQSVKANASSRGETVQAADTDWWPMFHHDLNHTGTSTSTAPTTNNTQWSYTTGSYILSSPAVVVGLVYVGSQDGQVYCLNAATGAFVWSYTTGRYVGACPAVVGGLVYVGSEDHNVYCLNATTGAFVWSYTTGDVVESSPAVVVGLVYVGSYDGNVYCLNATTGTLVWSYPTGSEVFSSPAVVVGLVYVGSMIGKVYCLNVTSGSLVWSYTTGGSVLSSPAVVNGVVYVGSDDGKIYSFGPLPLTVSISPTSIAMDVGQSHLFTSTVSGGMSPYSYQWCLNNSPMSGMTSPSWAFSPSSSGSYTIYLNVTDSVGNRVKSNVVLVTVNPAPSASISPSSVTLDVNQSQTFTSSVSGGTSPFSYQWYLNGAPVSGATSSSWTFTPSSSGSYTICVTVTDSLGIEAKSSTVPVTVNGALSVTIAPTSATLDIGQSQLFTSTVLGGTSPYSYQWYLNGATVPNATGVTWTFTPASTGSYSVYANVTDGGDVQAKSNVASAAVNAALSASISPASVTIDVGQSKTFTSSVSGGTSPFSYQWYLNGTAVSGVTSPSWTFTPSSSGSYSIHVNVTDSVGSKAKSNVASATVYPAPGVSISPSYATLNAGRSQTFTSSISGGTPPYSYQWYLCGSAVGGATNPTWTCTFSLAGTYTVYLRLTDNAESNTTSSTVNLYVYLSVTISPSAPVIMEKLASKVFTATAVGGATPYKYRWVLFDDLKVPVASGTGNPWNCTVPKWAFLGTGELQVVANDSQGKLGIAYEYVNILPDLAATISPSSVTLVAGQNQTFTSSTSGGAPPYSYQWYLNNASISGATNPTWTFSLTSSGSYTVYLNVVDSTSVKAKSNIATVTVKRHYVAVTNFASSKTVVGQGFSDSINVTVANYGSYTETFKVTVLANATSIASQNITLSIGQSDATTFVWKTTIFARGRYTINVQLTLAPGETNTAYNTYTYGTVKVTIPGDVNGDFFVNIKDATQVGFYWQQHVPPAPANVDINDDGIINIKDATIIGVNWQKHA